MGMAFQIISTMMMMVMAFQIILTMMMMEMVFRMTKKVLLLENNVLHSSFNYLLNIACELVSL